MRETPKLAVTDPSIANLPPGLSTPPLLQTLALIADPIVFFDRCRQRYGNTFTARVLGLNSPPVVFFGNPEAIKTIFTAPPNQFSLGQVTHVFRPLTGETSLITLDGADHQRQRKWLMPPFHGDRLQFYGDLICQLTHEAIECLPKNSTFAIRPILSDITLQVILRVVFGLESGARYQQFKRLISQMLESITNPFYSSCFFFPVLQKDLGSWSPWGQFIRQQKRIDELIYAEINERRQQANSEQTDILSLLLSAQDEDGQPMRDRELRDQLITLLLLGHETTASSLTWAFYWLYTLPQVLQKLQQELKSLENKTDPEAIAQLPYLNAVCQETLRVYPIALIAQPRVVRTPIVIEGYTYDPGTILIPCIYLAHRRCETFSNAHQFKPERFLECKFTPYEYFPFGGGVRSCVGGAFSLYEMKLVLATILSRLKLKFVERSPHPIKPVRRGITIVPASSIQMAIE